MYRSDGHLNIGNSESHIDIRNTLPEEAQAAIKSQGFRIHTSKPATIEQVRERIAEQKLKHAFLICDNADALAEACRELGTGAETKADKTHLHVSPFFWIRDWAHPEKIPEWVSGIGEVHPVIDQREATTKNLSKLMEWCRQSGKPILIHSEDEKDGICDPCHIRKLAEKYPDVKIIVAHAGGYGSIMAVQTQGPSYKNKVLGKVHDMIDVAIDHPNVTLSTSSLVIKEKSALLKEGVDRCPALLNQISIGTDFPLASNRRHPLIYTDHEMIEKRLHEVGFTDKQIQRIYSNNIDLAPPLTQAQIDQLPVPQERSFAKRISTEPSVLKR